MYFVCDWRGALTYRALLVLPEYYLHQSRRPHHILQLCGPWRKRSYSSKKSVTAQKIMTVSFVGPWIFSPSFLYTVTKRIVVDFAKKKSTQWKPSVGKGNGYKQGLQNIYSLGLYWCATKTKRSAMFLVTLNPLKRVLFCVTTIKA